MNSYADSNLKAPKKGCNRHDFCEIGFSPLYGLVQGKSGRFPVGVEPKKSCDWRSFWRNMDLNRSMFFGLILMTLFPAAG